MPLTAFELQIPYYVDSVFNKKIIRIHFFTPVSVISRFAVFLENRCIIMCI